MQLIIGTKDATQLAASISTSGAKKECARTLKAEILQSPTDENIPVIPASLGSPVLFTADGQYFVGSVVDVSRTTSGSTISVTAKDHGIFLTQNKITTKVKKMTPPAAAAQIAAEAGVPVGDLAAASLVLNRKFVEATVYDAIMAGYVLDAEQSGKKYYLIMDGTNVCVRERGTYIAATLESGVNLMTATYSESRGDADTTRKGTVQNLGGAECITGNAVMVKEPFTGLYGLFYIDADTHTWKRGLYTNKLTLAWENTMDESAAKAAQEISKSSKPSTGGTTDKLDWTKPDGTQYTDEDLGRN